MPITNQEIKKIKIKKLKSINDLYLSFVGHQVTAILGPNGNGKSTILHALACCFEPVSGESVNYKFSYFFLPHPHAFWQGSELEISHSYRNGPILHEDQIQKYSKNSDRWAPKYARRPRRDVTYIGIDTCVPMIESEKRQVRLHYSTEEITEVIIETILQKVSYILNRQYTTFTLNDDGHGRKFMGIESEGVDYTALSMSAGEQKAFYIIEKIFRAKKHTLVLIDEIDLLLHDLAVSRLIEVIVERARAKSLQIIFTTHRESIIDHSDIINIRHLINKPTKTLCFNETKPDAINRLTGKRVCPIEIYVEDELSKTIIKKIASTLRIQRYISVKKFGAAINCFTVIAGLLLNDEDCDNSLFVLDGDVYKTDVEKVSKINNVLTGNDQKAITGREIALNRIYQYELPEGFKPERFIHLTITALQVQENEEHNEIINVAQGVIAEQDDHKYIDEIIDQMGWDYIVGLSKIVDLFATTVEWDEYVSNIYAWLLNKKEHVLEIG